MTKPDKEIEQPDHEPDDNAEYIADEQDLDGKNAPAEDKHGPDEDVDTDPDEEG